MPYEDLAVQLGETGPLDEAALAVARPAATAAAATASSSTRVLAALLRGVGFVVTHHQAVVGGEGPTNHMALLVHSTASAGWPTPASARASSSRCRSARAATSSGRSPTRWSASPAARGGSASTSGARSAASGWPRRQSAGRGLRAPPPAAGDRPGVELRPDAGRPAAARGPDRHAARPDAVGSVGPAVDEKRVVDDRDEFGRGAAARSSGSRSAARAWIACGARRAAQHDAFLARA